MSYEWVCLLRPKITCIPRAKKFSRSLCQLHKIIVLHEAYEESKGIILSLCFFSLAHSKQLLLEQRKKRIDTNNIHTSQIFFILLWSLQNYIQNKNVEVTLRSWINKRIQRLVNKRHARYQLFLYLLWLVTCKWFNWTWMSGQQSSFLVTF